MTNRKIVVAVLIALSAGLAAACGRLRVRGPENRPDADLVLLLPDAGSGATGGAAVSGGGSTTALDSAREFTLIAADGGPTRVRVMSESDIKRQFGDVLAAMPPAPLHFTLFFRFESDELTDESRRMVPDVLAALKDRPVPEVSVVGHTDTTGTSRSNVELGMKRGIMVQGLLVQAGLNSSAIEVTSHGEAVLLVTTPDETYEPRNRRVEITIR
jgi:outer membrane protein OmpA-like peptidoglycan-associated protein